MLDPAFAEIAHLSIAERIQLVEDIWDTITVNPEELLLTRSQVQELDARLDSRQQNSQVGATWKEVKQRLRSQE